MTGLDGWLDRSNIVTQVWRTGGCYSGQNRAFAHDGLFCLCILKGDILSESTSKWVHKLVIPEISRSRRCRT